MSKIISSNRYFQIFRLLPELQLNHSSTVTFVSEVDLTEIEKVRSKAGKYRPSYTAFVVKALSRTLQEFPYANQRISRRAWLPFAKPRLHRFDRCDIAVAIEKNIAGAEAAAGVEMIREANSKSLQEITTWLSSLSHSDKETSSQWREFDSIIRRCPTWLTLLLVRLPLFIPKLWEKHRGGVLS